MKEYFSHDYNARNDKKLIRLFMKHGISGIGIYWCIIEMLFEETGYLNIDEYERIAFELRINNDTIKSVVEDFELFKEDGVKFWSESAIERLTERMNRSLKARASVMKRWNKKKNDTNVLQSNNEGNTIKVKERKGNKQYIYNQFYDEQLKLSGNDSDYILFVKFLFGNNSINQKLTGALSIKNQLLFEQFDKLLPIFAKNGNTLRSSLLGIENDKKYYKGKKSLYLTLNNWAKNNFKK